MVNKKQSEANPGLITPSFILLLNLLMSDSISKPLNESIKQSIDPVNPRSLPPDRSSVNEAYPDSIVQEPIENTEVTPKSSRKYKILTGCGACLMVLGLLMFLLFPPLIQSQIESQAIDQAILSPDNQKFWAHFPGDSKTIITRNYSFFNFTNEQNFFLYGEKPVFREIQGYIITEIEDYLDITYNDDMSMVKMKDWLRFGLSEDSRDLEEKFKILNLPALGYWYTLKNSRDQLLFIEGFSLLFRSIEDSIINTVVGQGISSQYLKDFSTANGQIFQPAGISLDNAFFLWNDTAYGFQEKNNIKYWVEAAEKSFNAQQEGFSQLALDLKDYFTLSDFELFFILKQMNQYSASLLDLIFDNHYCMDLPACDARQLAVRQISESYVTFKTPPVANITPTYTICDDNVTCNGSYPELFAYYNNVYLKEHPEADPFLTFDAEMVRKWVDYNPTRKPGEYNKAQSALLHIGNLDALFANGSLHDKTKKAHHDTTPYLVNIMNRFQIQEAESARVFWEWIKYLVKTVIKQDTPNNQKLGIANSFSSAMFTSFDYLQDHLQNHVLLAMLTTELSDQTCGSLIGASLQQPEASSVVISICNYYGNNVQSDVFVHDSMEVCKRKYGKQWKQLETLGATNLQIESFCDKSVQNGFGQFYHRMRVQINDFYQCYHTPNPYCSDYELALIQWVNSTVTLTHPPQAASKLKATTTFKDWDSKAQAFEYYHYRTKFAEKQFPVFTIEDAYGMFNFEHIYSATSNIKMLKDPTTKAAWVDYVRYITVFVGLKGITNERTAREYIFGYNDEYLLWRKNNYPPFGGDPSTPAFTAFNDPNITSENDVTLQVEWHTGKANKTMTAQHYKINGYTYLTTNYTRFNGNETYWQLDGPWAETDYFYGTSGKSFAPDQPNTKNVSIYVPNLQRYGSGSLNESYPYERYGYDLSIAYLGRYIYQPASEYPENTKYYQQFFGVFNQTAVVGAPLFMTKHHFMNCTSNWSSYVTMYNEDETILYNETSHWDDSYVIVEPYTGVSFQSTLFLQGNYYHEADELFTFNQTCLLPVFAVYRSGNLTEAKANQLFNPLTTALNVKTAMFYIGIVLTLLGVGLLVLSVINLRKIKKRNEQIVEKRSIKISMQEQKKKKPIKTESQILREEDERYLNKPLIREQDRSSVSVSNKEQIEDENQLPKSEV